MAQIESIREEFRGYRARFVGHDVRVFDERVQALAVVLADGKEPGPLCYLNAAREVVFEREHGEGPWAKRAA
jgi:hypothetical protein